MLRDQDGGCAGVLQLMGVLGIGEKRELGGRGVLHAGHAGNFERAVAMELAREGAREVGKLHDFRVAFARALALVALEDEEENRHRLATRRRRAWRLTRVTAGTRPGMTFRMSITRRHSKKRR